MPVSSTSTTLCFPNQCRDFDATRNRVRFWGYDSAIEISFFVEAAALWKLSSESGGTEGGILKAFDAARDRIEDVANKVYLRSRKDSYAYILVAEDF